MTALTEERAEGKRVFTFGRKVFSSHEIPQLKIRIKNLIYKFNFYVVFLIAFVKCTVQTALHCAVEFFKYYTEYNTDKYQINLNYNFCLCHSQPICRIICGHKLYFFFLMKLCVKN